MSNSMISFRLDSDLKSEMTKICDEMGMSLTAAFTIFAKKVARERRIPFDVAAEMDDFSSDFVQSILADEKEIEAECAVGSLEVFDTVDEAFAAL